MGAYSRGAYSEVGGYMEIYGKSRHINNKPMENITIEGTYKSGTS